MAPGILILALAVFCVAQATSPPRPAIPVIPAPLINDNGNWRRELLAEQLNIRPLTEEYNQNHIWGDLRAGLERALDHNSAAYKQLETIPSDSVHALEIIGVQGFTELAALLTFVGTSPDIGDADADTILHGTAIGDQINTARLLLDTDANIEAKDNYGSTPLVLASKHNHLAMVKFLLGRGADVNGASYYGWTALFWAADNGNLPTAQILVRAGASTTLEDKDGKTAFVVAEEKNHTQVAEYLSHFPH